MKDRTTIEISDDDLKDLDMLHNLALYFCDMTNDGSEQSKEDYQSLEDGFKVLARLWQEMAK
jgi:hypothetical protein